MPNASVTATVAGTGHLHVCNEKTDGTLRGTSMSALPSTALFLMSMAISDITKVSGGDIVITLNASLNMRTGGNGTTLVTTTGSTGLRAHIIRTKKNSCTKTFDVAFEGALNVPLVTTFGPPTTRHLVTTH